MNELLPYLVKSTLSLSLLYLAFRAVMHKEALFALNRMVLLVIVVFSFIIPLLYLPSTIKPNIQKQIIPQVSFYESEAEPTTAVEMGKTTDFVSSPVVDQKEKPFPYSRGQYIFLIYLAGVLFSLIVFIHGIVSVLLMLCKAQRIKMEGIHLFILEEDIPAFSFCKMVFISREDYIKHGSTILAHEQQHIRLGHFYDLMLMEMVKMVHWFNPIIYWLIQDLKAIHEFQADQYTLTQGIDARKYQLLIIEKGVGPQRLALANSFNHCQIKKRITMMNKSKTSKAGIWKVATFLPLLALLLMAFGRTGENVQKNSPSERDILNQEKTIVKEPATQTKDSVYLIAERMPEFPGGEKALRKYIAENVKYPESAKAKKTQGKVFVAFIINSQGKVINPKVVRSIDPELDAEALRVISIMPQWSPAKDKGKPVSMSYTIPINFVLSPGHSDKKSIIVPDNGAQNKDKHSHFIWLNDDGSLSYNLSPVSINDLEQKIKAELQKDPKSQFVVSIYEGKIDERVIKVKEIMKRSGDPKVTFAASHIEKVTDSNGKLSSKISVKPIDIK